MPVAEVLYPVNLDLSGKRCVVVGGGSVASRKVAGLVASGANVTVIAPEISDAIKALPVDVQQRPYHEGDLAGAWLAITAVDNPEVGRRVWAEGQAARVWVNAADDPAGCSFTLPAVYRQGPVTVAVSTAGHSPALAAWIRERVAGELGPEVGLLAQLLSEARDSLKAAGRSTEDVDWRRALDSDMLELIRNGHLDQARERLQACLS